MTAYYSYGLLCICVCVFSTVCFLSVLNCSYCSTDVCYVQINTISLLRAGSVVQPLLSSTKHTYCAVYFGSLFDTISLMSPAASHPTFYVLTVGAVLLA